MSDLQTAYRKFAFRVSAPMAAVVAVLLLAQVAAILFLGWYQTDVAQEAEARLAGGAVQDQLNNLERTALDYGTWNEAYDRLVQGVDAVWADENLATPLTQTLGLDVVALVQPDDTVSYTFAVEADERLAPADIEQSNLKAMLAEQRWGLTNDVVSGLVMLRGAPALVAVAPMRRINAPADAASRRLLLVLVKSLDARVLAAASQTFLLPELAVVEKTERRSPSAALRTRDGTEFARLAWKGARPGDALLLFALPLWVVLALGFGCLTWLIFRQAKSAADMIGDSEHRAQHDPLTGLPNRAHLARRLESACAALGPPVNDFAVLYLDLDGFKQVNDVHGHEAGDVVLRIVAHRILAGLPIGAVAARLGGDEFALILPRVTASGPALRFGRSLIGDIERPIPLRRGLPVVVSATIGAAFAPREGNDPATLLRQADEALYRGKRTGKGRICLATGEAVAA